MKSLWWILALVFILGIGTGSRMVMQQPQGADLPAFSAPETQAPTQKPTLAPIGKEEYGLPCAFQYTTLKALKLVSYDGPYWEDGTGEDVFALAALLVENTGTTGLDYACITVQQGTRELTFDATYIPPRSRVLILEENRQSYSDEPITACQCRTVIPGSFDLRQRIVRLEDVGLSGLKVTNITQETAYKLRIYYKHYDRESGAFLGGITYSVTVDDLQPGACLELHPYRYTPGYTQAVAVTVE